LRTHSAWPLLRKFFEFEEAMHKESHRALAFEFKGLSRDEWKIFNLLDRLPETRFVM
jgi:hypothetical protein